MSNYELNIISNHPRFNGKTLKKYNVDNIETVGAYGDENFTLVFKNNTWKKIQLKLSIDGTDLLTGGPASTEVNKNMWVVEPYATLSLKAWPENSAGGSAFVFTGATKSVALHTHGDLSNRGIIAAAVYVEGHVEPERIYSRFTLMNDSYLEVDRERNYGDDVTKGGTTKSFTPISESSGSSSAGHSQNFLNEGVASFNASDTGQTFDFMPVPASVPTSAPASSRKSLIKSRTSKRLENLVAVGAGKHVDQKITYVTGLTKPVLSETIRVRYLWWDDLVSKLKEYNVPSPHASGFPGDKPKPIMSIGNTPKVGEPSRRFLKKSSRVEQPVYDRF